MCNNIYLQEKHIEEQLRQRQNAVKRQHLLSHAAAGRHRLARHIVSRCGALLVALGTWLEHVEPREQQAASTYE
ncbi:MAG: hypothetical protein ACJ788_27385 [Ktedonobacteraceae bacterium]|jgi:hypothetical protein